MDAEIYDNILMEILQNEQRIEPFLNIIFNFLLRRTDFYKILDAEKQLGFASGVAEKLVYNAFRKYQLEARIIDEKVRTKNNRIAENHTVPSVPCVDHTEEVETSSDIPVDANCGKSCEQKEAATTTDSEIPKEIERKEYQAEADSYNGAICDGYSWSQSGNDVDVRIKIPANITKGKDVKVDIKHDHITAKSRNNENEWETVLDGQLSWKINLEKSMWTLVPGECILVCLEKTSEQWWESLLVSEPKINVQEIDATRYLDELPDDEQAKVHELMYNQQQKLLGKPTSEEMKIHNILKDAWDKEGSPFRGQPFDPSVVNICGEAGSQSFALPQSANN